MTTTAAERPALAAVPTPVEMTETQRRRLVAEVADMYVEWRPEVREQFDVESFLNCYAALDVVASGTALARWEALCDAIVTRGRCVWRDSLADLADEWEWEGTLDSLEERVRTFADDALDDLFRVA